MKKTLFVVFFALFVLCVFAGCSKYSSKYSAVASVTTNTTGKASLSFSSFNGTRVFKMRNKGGTDQLQFSARLQNGSLNVYYDCNGTKQSLFSLKSGDELSSSLGGIPTGEIYIIIETDGKCQEGRLEFELK